jgi:hypothetical protein
MHAERTRKWPGGEKFSALQTAEEYGLPLVAELLGRRCPEPVAPRRWAVAMVAVVDGPRPSHRRTRCGGAHRRLGPSCSASTSTTDRGASVLAGPAALLQPAHDHHPAALRQGDSAACSAWSRHTTRVKNDGSCSRRLDTATRNIARAIPPSV